MAIAMKRFATGFALAFAGGVVALTVFLGASHGQPASLETRLETVLDELADHAPGAILIVSSDTIDFEQSRGLSDRGTNAPMRTDHTLRIASITKSYMAVLTLMAVEDDLVDLDAPISTYLDADIMDRLPAGLDPNVRHLLNHTSGVPDYYSVRFYFMDWRDRGPLSPELALHAIRGKQATQSPGQGYSYSNTNYHLIALILEAVFDQTVDHLLQTRIFEPLGLERTYYSQMFAPGDDVHGYGGVILPWVDTYQWQENTGPDGGMFASAEDLITWIRAVFSPEGRFYDYGVQMQTDPVRESARIEQGMGVEILTSRSGAQVMGHTGGLDGYAVAAFYIPDEDAVMVLFTNTSGGDAFSSALGGALRAVTVE